MRKKMFDWGIGWDNIPLLPGNILFYCVRCTHIHFIAFFGQTLARSELGKPFPQEAELKQKSARLAELDASLNMDNARHGPEPEETKAAPKHKREEVR